MSQIRLVSFIALAASCLLLSLNPLKAAAATHSQLVNDLVFDNSSSMSSGDIDVFLNNQPNSCISQNSGFMAPDPIGYNPSQGFLYGINVSAGNVIAHAAQVYSLNPQVLLTTLQKEQSLVTGSSGCSDKQFAASVGYGCPDSGGTYSYSGVNLFTRNGVTHTSVSGTCVNSASKVGFSQQVIRAAWLLKFAEQRSEGNTSWAVISGNWNNADDLSSCYSGPMTQGYRQQCPGGANTYYDGYTTIDGTSTYISTGSTAALYDYTPHFSGNDNFDTIFQNWFGSPTATYSSDTASVNVYSDSSQTQQVSASSMQAGTKVWVVMRFHNNGTATWYNSGYGSVRLATMDAGNSPFCDTSWISCTRPVGMQESSVTPGGTGTFAFWYTAPSILQGAQYTIHFSLVAEMLSWVSTSVPNIQTYVNPLTYTTDSDTMATYSDNTETQPVLSNSMLTGSRIWVVLRFHNSGNTTWYNSGNNPVRLAAFDDNASQFCDAGWINCGRLATMQESSVAPGSYGTFKFWYDAPSVSQATFLPGRLGLVAEYLTSITGDTRTMYTTAVPQIYATYDNTMATYSDNTETQPVLSNALSSGSRIWVVLRFRNDGNQTWYNSGSNPVRLALMDNGTSVFQDTSWLNSGRLATMQESSVAPGSYGTFKFWYDAPSVSRSTGTIQTHLGPVAESKATIGGQQRTMYTVVNP